MSDDAEAVRLAARAIVKSLPPETVRAMASLAADGRLTAVLESALVRAAAAQRVVDYVSSVVRAELVPSFRALAASLGEPGSPEVHTTNGARDVRRAVARWNLARRPA